MKKFIEWSKEFETGISIIDTQHKQIVDYINALEAANTSGNKSHVLEVIDALVEYTFSHFKFEESLQEKAGYQMCLQHKTDHLIFTKHIERYQLRAINGEDISVALLSFLKTWLTGHILKADMAYVSVVKNVVVGSQIARLVGKFKKVLVKESTQSSP